jgi:hypothetical protein
MWMTRPNFEIVGCGGWEMGDLARLRQCQLSSCTSRKKKKRGGPVCGISSVATRRGNKASFSRPVGRERGGGAIAYLFRHLEIRGKESSVEKKRGNLEIFANQRQGLGTCRIELGLVARAALSTVVRGPPESHPGRYRSWAGTTFRGQLRYVRTLRSGAARRTTPSSGEVVGERSGRRGEDGAQKREEGEEAGRSRAGGTSFSWKWKRR